ncbi:hypothetical protein COT47_00765 [Candidatus Woesearchaeota archaeon CG08_land_8_20_14_0_20_43_7]|nr:MAG: hypothetical protein COT47_00765 [Candidatus Woesearchaeota archaeon CG08_land_8_20_14_0_20_43_7]
MDTERIKYFEEKLAEGGCLDLLERLADKIGSPIDIDRYRKKHLEKEFIESLDAPVFAQTRYEDEMHRNILTEDWMEERAKEALSEDRDGDKPAHALEKILFPVFTMDLDDKDLTDIAERGIQMCLYDGDTKRLIRDLLQSPFEGLGKDSLDLAWVAVERYHDKIDFEYCANIVTLKAFYALYLGDIDGARSAENIFPADEDLLHDLVQIIYTFSENEGFAFSGIPDVRALVLLAGSEYGKAAPSPYRKIADTISGLHNPGWLERKKLSSTMTQCSDSGLAAGFFERIGADKNIKEICRYLAEATVESQGPIASLVAEDAIISLSKDKTFSKYFGTDKLAGMIQKKGNQALNLSLFQSDEGKHLARLDEDAIEKYYFGGSRLSIVCDKGIHDDYLVRCGRDIEMLYGIRSMFSEQTRDKIASLHTVQTFMQEQRYDGVRFKSTVPDAEQIYSGSFSGRSLDFIMLLDSYIDYRLEGREGFDPHLCRIITGPLGEYVRKDDALSEYHELRDYLLE